MARELALISQPEPLSEEAALATLTAAGRTVTGFARQLGVGAHPRRALKRWEAAGHITRLTDDAGRLVILANTIEPTAPPPLPPARLVEPIDLVPPSAPPTVTLTRARASAHRLAAIAVMLLAGAIAICGLKVNAWKETDATGSATGSRQCHKLMRFGRFRVMRLAAAGGSRPRSRAF
jgi:hypothetical protein